MLTKDYAKMLPHVRVNDANPGLLAAVFTGGQGQSVQDGADEPTGTSVEREGTVARLQ